MLRVKWSIDQYVTTNAILLLQHHDTATDKVAHRGM